MKKIYTRTGDKGTTSLFGGGRVEKSHPRIDAYGTVDETNSFVGMALAHLAGHPGEEKVAPLLERLQQELFVLGADLATPMDAKPVVPRIDADYVEQLEREIDAFQADLPELRNFILPGGTPAGATLHVARTVCRRAERRAVEASAAKDINEQAVVYLNRLSDLFFVLARWVNHRAEAPETTWTPSDV